MKNIYVKQIFSFLFAGSILIAFPFFVHADHTNEHTIEQLQAQISSLFAEITALRDQIASRDGSGEVPPTKVEPVTICPRFTYNFYLGMDDGDTDGQITDLQKILAVDADVYPESLITGYYGPLTEQAVRRYQKKHGIVSSGSPDTTGYGVVGPATRTTLLQRCGPTVVPPQPFSLVKIASPNGGESWQIGSTQTIEWSSFKPFSYIDIDLLSWTPTLPPCTYQCPTIAVAPGFSAAIARKAPNTGSLSWRVGNILSDSTVPAGAYVIKVSNSENTGVYDQSDSYFKITFGTVPDTNNSPVISGVSGPQSLDINQKGTWVVKAYDRNGENLSYDVDWGDGTSGVPGGLMQGQENTNTTRQSATFTHSYSRAGIYKPTFTVTSENTIRCITTPCPTNGGTAQTSLSVNVGNVTNSSSITVLSPNGGETIIQGVGATISWTSRNAPSNATVYLSLISESPISGSADKALTSGSCSNIIPLQPATGSFFWDGKSVCSNEFLETISTGKFRVLAQLRSAGKIVETDSSDASFSIISDNLTASYRDSRRVTSVRQLQLALELYWDAKQSYPISLYLLPPTYLASLPEDPLGNMYHYVTLPDGCVGTAANPCTGYHMGSSLEVGTYVALRSDADYDSTALPGGINGSDQGPCRPIGVGIVRYCYDVKEGTTSVTRPAITLITPNGGDVWKVGETRQISWETSGISNPNDRMTIYIVPAGDSSKNYNLAQEIPNTGSYSYVVDDPAKFIARSPLYTAGGQFKIFVCAKLLNDRNLCSNGIGYSNTFSIVSSSTPASPSITILSPNGGETWVKGSSKRISWLGGYQDLGDEVRLIKTSDFPTSNPYSNYPYYAVKRADNTASSSPGSYTWIVGNIDCPDCATRIQGIPEGTYIMRVIRYLPGGQSVYYDDSNAPFTISALPNPQLIFTGTQNYTGSDGNSYVKYSLSVSNWSSYPNSMFTATSSLPPCGLNANSSRTWVNVYNTTNNTYVYGFCALGSAQDLTALWFGIPQGSNPPQSVYVTINDRQTGVVYRSNAVVTLLPDLTVSDIYSDAGKLSIKVQNIGVVDAPIDTGHLYIWIDDQLKWTYSVSTWSTKDYRLVGGFTIVQPQVLTGTHKIKATIDPNGAVGETNENNNTLEKTIAVDPVSSRGGGGGSGPLGGGGY